MSDQVLRRGPGAGKAAKEEAGDSNEGGRMVPVTCNAAQINEVGQSRIPLTLVRFPEAEVS